MEYGLNLALNEISLVLFTTLAPSGVTALIIMGMLVLFGKVPSTTCQRINHGMCVPIVISMLGLIVSATHLGNPENVLYVFARTGASPLSNEVASAAVFLALAGTYWLYSFAQKPNVALQKTWLIILMVAGVAFVAFIALAYSSDTVISWSTKFVPLNIVLNSLVGGPVLALVSLRGVKGFDRVFKEKFYLKFSRGFERLSLVAIATNVASMVFQNIQLGSIENELFAAAALVPYYGVVIVLFALLCVLGVFLLRRSEGLLGFRAQIAMGLGCLSTFFGIFLTRIVFYAMHLTVGLGA